ncbi:hypothetical protein ACFZB9_11210 [Kitasatospora sp. NPDC008050]|uniref:hypothetical protein n=1 Tax=Kitasatospora sp. NPDC008050 TaxID=3364021 RepID=UPI0036E1F1A5
MDLQFVGIDPETQGGGSPTVWVDAERHEIVIQGWRTDEATTAKISTTEWVTGHDIGIPEHETVIRVPARMVPALREACDSVAGRTGLQ